MPPRRTETRRGEPNGPVRLYEALKQAMLNGEFAPGEQLVETALAARFSVSRTPIREALTRLEQDGLAQRTTTGLVVRERSPEEVLDIYDARCVLEALAAEIAAARRTDYDLGNLERLVEGSARVDQDDPRAMAADNHEFHLGIWRACHNETVLDLLQRLDFHLHRYPETTLAFPGRWNQSLDQHRVLVEAIRDHDAKAAGEIAASHFKDAREIRLKLWARDPRSL